MKVVAINGLNYEDFVSELNVAIAEYDEEVAPNSFVVDVKPLHLTSSLAGVRGIVKLFTSTDIKFMNDTFE